MGRHGVETVLGAVVLLVVGMFMFFAYSAAQVKAVVVMSIVADIKLPTDIVASIGSEGIVGSKYVRLEPGVEKTFIEAGGAISQTKDFRSLEDKVGEIIFLTTGGSSDGGQ